MPTTTSCQICGQAIETVQLVNDHGAVAVIAPHSLANDVNEPLARSCFGSEWPPFEVACDALVALIAKAENVKAETAAALEMLRKHPPEELTYDTSRTSSGERTTRKPKEFDPALGSTSSIEAGRYEREFWARDRVLKQRLAHASRSWKKCEHG